MPLAPTRNLYFLKPSGAAVEDLQHKPSEDGLGRDDNVLLERRYLNLYWHYFRASIGVQMILGSCFVYGGIGVATGTLNVSILRTFAGFGIVL